jgi:hypothetical protein
LWVDFSATRTGQWIERRKSVSPLILSRILPEVVKAISRLYMIAPDREVRLNVEPNELAPVLLRLGKQNRQDRMFMLGAVPRPSTQAARFGRLRMA